MAILNHRDVMNVVAQRGLRIALGPWCSPFPPEGYIGLLVIRPDHVPQDEVTPALIGAIHAWQREIRAELLSRESPHG